MNQRRHRTPQSTGPSHVPAALRLPVRDGKERRTVLVRMKSQPLDQICGVYIASNLLELFHLLDQDGDPTSMCYAVINHGVMLEDDGCTIEGLAEEELEDEASALYLGHRDEAGLDDGLLSPVWIEIDDQAGLAHVADIVGGARRGET